MLTQTESDARFFDFAFLPGCAGIASPGIKIVFAGEGEEARVEADEAAVVLGDDGQ